MPIIVPTYKNTSNAVLKFNFTLRRCFFKHIYNANEKYSHISISAEMKIYRSSGHSKRF